MLTPRFRRYLACLAGFFLLAACKTTHYDYTPPATDQGRLCTAQCSNTREICRGNENRRAQMERSNCERSANAGYYACLSHAGNRDQEKDCERRRPGCWASEDYERCERDYRQCFSNCGGEVRSYKK